MMGKDRIESVIRSLREEVFHRVSLYLKDRRKVRVDAGKRGSESTFVHFRQLFQEGGTDLPSLHITGKNGHKAFMSGDAARGGPLSVFPLLMRLCGGRA